jgi:hypothetical protein
MTPAAGLQARECEFKDEKECDGGGCCQELYKCCLDGKFRIALYAPDRIFTFFYIAVEWCCIF